MVGGRLAMNWSGDKMKLSSSLHRILHLFVFVAVASYMAHGQNAFNFNLSPLGAQVRSLSPTTSVSVTCVWDVQDYITVEGVIDQTVILKPLSLNQTSKSSQGKVVFGIAGSTLSTGKHVLVITATNGTTVTVQASTQAITEVLLSSSISSNKEVNVSITVFLYNEEYLTGLVLNSTRDFYEAVNSDATLTASVVTGTGLQALWATDNNPFVQVNVSSKTFTSPLKWTTIGSHSVFLNVSNIHGSVTAQTDVIVLYPINGVTFSTSQVKKAINEEVVLTLVMSNKILQPMGNITYELAWDTDVTEFGNLDVTAGQVTTFTHSYAVQGDRNVTLLLTSPAQSRTFWVSVRIWDNLNVSLQLSATVGLPGNYTLTFVNPPTAGFSYYITCGMPDCTFQSKPSAWKTNFSPPSSPFSVTLNAVGVYVFTFQAYNNMYSLSNTYTIIVENFITASSLALSSAKDQIPTVDSAITVYASAVDKTKPTTFFCTWNSGQNDQANAEFFNFPANFPIAQNFEFASAGYYTVTLHCWNNISDYTFTYSTMVYDWQLENFRLSYENTQNFSGNVPPTPVLFSLSLPNYALPTRKMSVTFDYGDGSPLDRPVVNLWNRSHIYPSRGIYNGSVLLEHQSKGNTTIAFSVRVGAIQLSVESLGGLVVTHLFRFFVSCPNDSDVYTATVYFGDGISNPSYYSNLRVFTHYYQTVGKFMASITGVCSGFSESAIFPGPLEVEGSVADVKLQIPQTVRHPPGDLTALVNLARPQHKIMNMTCKMYWDEILDSTLGTWTGSLQPTASFPMDFTYLTLGAKDLVLNCSNAYSFISLSADLFVDNKCFSPDPIFDRQFAKYHKPMVVLQSVRVRLITRTVILCTAHKPTFVWNISVYSPDGTKLSSYTKFEQPRVDYLIIERGELEPGLYRMALNISLGQNYNNSWLSESTFVKMERPPLVAEIEGGRIRKTGNPEAIIDARTGSYDPVKGYGNSDDLVFSWNCSVFNTTTIEDLQHLAKQSSPGDPQSCDSISTEIVDGKRQLNIGQNVEATGFLFQVAISSRNATPNIVMAYLQYNRGSLSIQIVCVMNCDRKVARSTSLVLSVTCDDCSDEAMANAKYRWTVFLIDSDTGQHTEVSNVIKGQTNKRGVVIKEKTLDSCKKYRVEANMTLEAAGGFAVREFLTNCPPWGGNCTMIPLRGNVLNETFRMSCSGWQDEGFEDDANSTDKTQLLLSPLIYKFLLRKNDTIVPISEGGEGKMAPTRLPVIPGDGSSEYELVARIYDPLQDFTEYSVTIELYLDEKNSNLQETLNFWDGQTNYSGNSSTLTKELRGITVACSLIANYNVSDNQTELQQALESNLETSKPVVSLDWNNLWSELKNPPDSPTQNNLTEVTDKFTNLVYKRGEEAKNLTGLGLTALAQGLSTILYKPETVSPDSVEVTTNITDMAVEALRKLYTTKPYPIAENLKEPVIALTSLVDRLVTASVPSYEVMSNTGIEFNASDLSGDDKMFVMERLEATVARKDHYKTELINKVMPQLEATLDAMTETLLVGMVVGQEPERVQRGGLSLMACKTTGETLASKELEVDPNNVALKIDDLIPESGGDPNHAELDVKARVFTKNPYPPSDLSSYDITSPVVKLDVRDKNGTVKVNKLTVTIKRGSKVQIPVMETFWSNDTRGGPNNLLYHQLSLLSPHSAIITYIKLPPDMGTVTAYFRFGRPPTLERYDVKTEEESLHSVRRRAVDLTLSQNNEALNAFKFNVDAGILQQGIIFVGFLVSGDNNDTYMYEYLSFTDSCRVWDEENRNWSPACKILVSSSLEKTVCECENPPGMTFASAFLVPPTTINFNLVFSKFDVNNAWVYGTMIGLLLVWVLGVLWARRQDKGDRERVGFLTDNVVGNSYFYLLTVHTGLKRGSGTKSNVSFVITGSQTDSGVRGLTDGKRSLATGSVMSYIMATNTCLGDLDYIRVWHDNSGGYQAGWYLSRMSVEDLQTGQRYMFVCERWFALDKDDGLVDRLVPLAQQDEVMSFDNLFSEFTKIGLTDSHLWFSCLLRPAPSAFTRVQRLSCCVVLLLLTMITSAMFYKPEDNETGASSNSMGLEVKVGIIRFSPTTLWTSFVSILITSIPTMLFVVMFRYSRPKPGPRARPTKHHNNQKLGASEESERIEQKDKKGQAEKSVADLPENKLQENPLPCYCRYVTWLLLLLTAAMCAFFLVLYSMQWGKTTSAEWLTSFFASFFESIFVVDPIKVIALALLLAFCAQNPYGDTAHKEHVDIECMLEEANTLGVDDAGLPAIPPDPVPQKVLLKARRRREQEQTSQRVFFELLLYTFFVFCVFCLSYTNRDENSNLLYQHLSGLYFDTKRNLGAQKDTPFLFEDIKSYDDVMKWLNDTIRPTLFPRVDTQGNTLQLGKRVFTSDPVTFRVGPVRVRQLRMPVLQRSGGSYPLLMNSRGYVPPYKWEEEERGRFCAGWKSVTCSYDDFETSLSRAAWTYQTLSDVSVLPVWGEYSTYSSGGYIMDFTVNWDVVSDTLQELQDGTWLDKQTRAVFVEFSLYNPDSNLFAYVRLGAEFPETGDTLVWKDIKIMRINHHLQAADLYTVIGEVIAVVAVLILTVVIVVKLKNQKLSFFSDFWQVLDVCTALCSYVAITFYAIKSLKVNESMAAWRENPKVYVDFYQAVFWDALYGYMLAAAVFITTLRLLRVLGYNKRLTTIGTVLSQSGKDLLGFSVVFLVVLMAYLSAGYLMFMTTQEDFRSPWHCALALYQILLGRNVLSIISEDGVLFAWIYFISFIVLVFLILMTMFQAILCNTSSIVHGDLKTIPPPYGLTNLFVKFYHTAIVDWLPPWLLAHKARAASTDSGPLRNEAGKKMLQQDERVRDVTQDVLADLLQHLSNFAESEKQKRAKDTMYTGCPTTASTPKTFIFQSE